MHRVAQTVALLAVATILGGCAAAPRPTGPVPSVDADALRISADDLRFSTDRLEAPADDAFQVVFENREGVPHNVSIYRDASAGQPVLVEPPFSGPATVVYDVPALAPGEYPFRCDLHPDMRGVIAVR